jgi:hypothetical protein
MSGSASPSCMLSSSRGLWTAASRLCSAVLVAARAAGEVSFARWRLGLQPRWGQWSLHNLCLQDAYSAHESARHNACCETTRSRPVRGSEIQVSSNVLTHSDSVTTNARGSHRFMWRSKPVPARKNGRGVVVASSLGCDRLLLVSKSAAQICEDLRHVFKNKLWERIVAKLTISILSTHAYYNLKSRKTMKCTNPAQTSASPNICMNPDDLRTSSESQES